MQQAIDVVDVAGCTTTRTCTNGSAATSGWLRTANGRGEAYRRAVELVPTEPVTRWQAAIVSGYSQVLMLTGRFEEARTEAERAIALAQQVPDGRSTEGHARNNLGCALGHLGEVERGVEELRTAARIAREELDDVDDIARAIVNLNSVLFDAGRFGEALAVSLGASRPSTSSACSDARASGADATPSTR